MSNTPAEQASNSIKDNIRSQWLQRFKQAVQYDIWGQLVEAQEEYRALAQLIAVKQGRVFVTSHDKDTLHRLVLCLSARVESLEKGTQGPNTVSSSDMKLLENVFGSLFTTEEPTPDQAFPINPMKFHGATPIHPTTSEGEVVSGDIDEAANDFYNSHQAVTNVKGTVVSLRLDKIGLKDAQFYIDPLITILVMDQKGAVMDKHDVPTSSKGRATYISFNHIVYLNISFEEMHASCATIFLEFKHFKPKKKKISTRCWTFMELPEMKRDEEIVLELYTKPTDLKKKKLKLHTEKPLYMHLFATFIRP